MLVIFGVTLPKQKKLIYALPDLYGIGHKSAVRICQELGYAPNLHVEDLTESQQYAIAKKIKEEFRIEGNLRELVKANIQRYYVNGSIRGFRHRNHLPVRGQRTHSNGKTPRRVILALSSKNLTTSNQSVTKKVSSKKITK
jgi:small subunit ribosomal protein S13